MPTSLIQEWIYAILKELNLHKGKAVLCFALVTCVVVTVGVFWPKKFESAAIVFADDQNIIKPLLAGQAEVTHAEVDQLQVVQQRVFSDELMKQVLLEAKLVDPAKLEDRYTTQPVIRGLLGALKVEPAGKNHIRFSFRNEDRNKAYTITSAVTNVFIRDAARSKREESSEAYKFIDNQVTTYKEQLQSAEDRLKDFKTKNPSSSEDSIARRMSELRTSTESLTLDLQVARARRDELRQQISHEKQSIGQSYKADVYRGAIAQAQSKLDTLRLSYQETYPDIVALKQQIEDLRHAAAQAESTSAGDQDGGGSVANPVYQKMKSDLSDAEVNVKTLELKLESSRRMLLSETENTKGNAEYQAQLAELSRDYNVTKQIYEDLLERKEKARMSVALDVQGQGLNYRIKEPATYPTAPVGLRFVHFFLLAPILGVLAPLALLVVYIQLDPRMRFVERVQPMLPESMLLVVVPHMTTQLERRTNRAEWGYLAVFVALVLLGYIIVAVVRLTGVV